MKAERDDPRPEAPADIFNLFPLHCRLYHIQCVHIPKTKNKKQKKTKKNNDDPRRPRTFSICSLLYNVVLYTMEALVLVHGLCIGWFLRVVSLVVGAQVPKLVL